MGPRLCLQSTTVSFGYELQAGLAETSVLKNFLANVNYLSVYSMHLFSLNEKQVANEVAGTTK